MPPSQNFGRWDVFIAVQKKNCCRSVFFYIKTEEDSVFTRSHAEFLLSFSNDQSFKRLSKLIRVTGTLENLNLPNYLALVLKSIV
jgi:hypothetical protein